MRVDFTNFGLEPPDRTKPGRAGKTGTAANLPLANDAAGANASAGADQASLSFAHARVAALAAKALEAPEVRQEKVASLGQALAEGRYSPDAAKVAEAIASEFGSGRVR